LGYAMSASKTNARFDAMRIVNQAIQDTVGGSMVFAPKTPKTRTGDPPDRSLTDYPSIYLRSAKDPD